jgi:predicted PurR-regulated permease PerM
MVRTVLTVAAVGVVLALLWAARAALLLTYVSALVAMGFSPLVHLIQRPRVSRRGLGVPRVLAILSVYLVVVGVVIIMGLVIVPPLIEQATTLWDRLPAHFNALERTLIRYRLMTRAVTLQEAVQNAPSGTGGNAVATVFAALISVLGGLFGLVTIVILSFYFLIEGEALVGYLTAFVPPPQRLQVMAVAAASVRKVSAWMRGQLTLAGLMGAAVTIGLTILHAPYVYVVAVIAAIGETIPVVGPLIAGTTAVAITLGVSLRLAVTVGVFFLVLHQIESNVLVPKIMEQRVGVSPAAVVIALLVGASLLGLPGAILAIPTAAILSVAIEEFSGINERSREDELGRVVDQAQ